MKLQTAATLAATLLVGLTGCSTPKATMRGQSVQHTAHNHNVNVVPNRTGSVSTIQNYFHDQHAFPDSGSYHSTTGVPGYSGFAGYGAAGAGGPSGACPGGACGNGCGPNCGHHCPHHYHSYSYQRPQCLQYPDANSVGGAVVYPYYTHKGPSDFFRDDGSVLGK